MNRRLVVVPLVALVALSTHLRAEASSPATRSATGSGAAPRRADSPSSVWGGAALDELARHPLTNPRNSRALAALHVALRDAIAAARGAGGPDSARERGAAAGAALVVLPDLVPSGLEIWRATATSELDRNPRAERASFQRGREIGTRVGREIAARVGSDGAAEPSEVPLPAGPGLWTGTAPVEPGAPLWRPWVIASSAAFRPAPPPAWDSPERRAELDEVRHTERTPERVASAHYWQSFEGVFTEWYKRIDAALAAHRLEGDALAAARVYAAAAMAHHDAMLAAWDGKYAYWTIRPFQLDPGLETIFPTPNHPSYPAAHAVVSTAIATTIAGFFPELADELAARAREAGESRLWAGVHYRSDLVAGERLGREVARAVVVAVRPPTAGERAAGGQ